MAYAPNDSSTTMNNENRSREPTLLSIALALTSVIVEFLSKGFQDEIFAVRFPTPGLIERSRRDQVPLLVVAELAGDMDRVTNLDRLCVSVGIFPRHTEIDGLFA